jgi:hypothetical protein
MFNVFGRVRTWLDQTLFPDPPPPQRISGRRALVFAGLAFLAVAIQMARMWPSAPLNSIWAEDGATWLGDAMKGSFVHALTTPYSGYLQTVSRLVAVPVAKLPVDWFAPAMAISGAAIVTGCAFVVWRAAAGHIKNAYLRGTLAAMVVLLPIVGVETLDNVTNSIWFLFFASFWILLWRPATFPRTMAAAVLLLLAVLTNGGTILLLPLWLLRLIAIRDRRDTVIVTAFAVGVATQLALSWDVRNLQGENPASFFAASSPQWHWALVPAYLQRIVGSAATGQRITGYMWVHLGTPFVAALGLVLIVFVVVAFAGTHRRTRVVVPLTVAISLGIFLFEGYQRWTAAGSQFLWPHGHAYADWDVPHYLVVPTLLLLSALFMQLDVQPRFLSATAWRSFQTAGVLFVLFVALLSFNVSDSAIRGSLTWSKALDLGRSQCLRMHPETVEIVTAPHQPPFPWEISISCYELTGSRFVSHRPPKRLTQALRTIVIIPTNGATLSGREVLDATATGYNRVTKVEFLLADGSHHSKLIAGGYLTLYGWFSKWNSTSVANGTYSLQSIAHDASGASRLSTSITITVKN